MTPMKLSTTRSGQRPRQNAPLSASISANPTAISIAMTTSSIVTGNLPAISSPTS